ncbi:MAG: hypothetical protein AAF409_02350 [Pseudomonadota bacterium]
MKDKTKESAVALGDEQLDEAQGGGMTWHGGSAMMEAHQEMRVARDADLQKLANEQKSLLEKKKSLRAVSRSLRDMM